MRNLRKKGNFSPKEWTELTLFRMVEGGGEERQKAPTPTSFTPVTSTNVGIRPQYFLTFSFNPFDTLL